MRRVTGIGGVFFKAQDPKALYAWYEKHLGIKLEPHGGGASFRWSDDGDPDGVTIWAIFPRDTAYFGAGPQTLMLNFRVENLDALLAELRKENVWVDPKREDYDYGRFAWIKDAEGNRVELWEPPRKSKP